MKRLSLVLVALTLVGGLAAGCSKKDEVVTPAGVVNADQIAGDATKCADLATSWSSMFTPLASPTFTDADKEKVAKAADEFKAKVPDSVKSDVDKITKGITESKSQTDMAKFLATKDYTDSFTKVTTYVSTDCAKVGG